MTKKKRGRKRNISNRTLYARINEDAMAFLNREVLRTEHFKSDIINEALMSIKEKRPYHLDKKELATVVRVSKSHESRMQKIRKKLRKKRIYPKKIKVKNETMTDIEARHPDHVAAPPPVVVEAPPAVVTNDDDMRLEDFPA